MAEISRREDARVCAPSGHDCAFSRAGSSCMDNIRLFADLPASAKRELLSCSRHSTHPAGSIIVHEGDPIESIVVVRSGRIKTFRTSLDGKEYVLDVLHDGQALWHGMFLADHTYRYSVACLTRVELCRIHRADFEALLANHPDVALGLIRMICTELDDAEEKIMMLGIRDPRRRLAEYLLARDGRCVGPEIHLKLEDIANSVGLRPETVSRNIAQFVREGLVERPGRGRLLVVDRAGLEAVAAE
ncbi:Crp/Fnr family transcriptional regulator [Paratractidigestivibacter faecalis]|uniref:Crp/Fnr family transcriptional regulator n=1 Tax=Paratractidigestivibacter faecalis TaxID=2292441 RepID=UPI003890A486